MSKAKRNGLENALKKAGLDPATLKDAPVEAELDDARQEAEALLRFSDAPEPGAFIEATELSTGMENATGELQVSFGYPGYYGSDDGSMWEKVKSLKPQHVVLIVA